MQGPYCKPGKCFLEYFQDGAGGIPDEYVLMSSAPPADGKEYVATAAGTWVPADSLLSLADLQAAICRRINALRDAKLRAGFTWGGNTFENDITSLIRISAAYTLAVKAKGAGDAVWSKNWITADNATVALSADDMIAVGDAATLHEQTMIYIAHAHKQAVLAMESTADIMAYDYTIGWEILT